MSPIKICHRLPLRHESILYNFFQLIGEKILSFAINNMDGEVMAKRAAGLFRFIVAQIWPQYLVHDTNTVLNLPQQRTFWQGTKTVASLGLTMNLCTGNYWPPATQLRGLPWTLLTAYACFAPKNPQYNATAAWLLNISQNNP